MKVILALLLALAVSGCGQSGPLYFAEPHAGAVAETAEQTPAAKQDNEEKAGDDTP